MVTIAPATPFLLLFWLLLVPLLAGLAISPLFPDSRKKVFFLWLAGLLLSFTIFEPMALFCMFRIVYAGFYHLSRAYAGVMLLFALAGLLRAAAAAYASRGQGLGAVFCAVFPGHRPERIEDLLHPRRAPVRIDRRFSRAELAYGAVFLVLLSLQLILAVLYAPFDGDDAYYVVQSLQSQQTGTIQTLQPYLGYSTSLDYRHALSEYPVWIAFLAASCRVHATILSHTLLPLFWIPVSYGVWACCGRRLFGRRWDLVLLFLCFLSLFVIFGNVSIYTPETFFLMRTWQGKSVIGNFVLPLMLYLFLLLAEQERDGAWRALSRRERAWPWLMLLGTSVAAGFFSTSGVLLVTMGVGMGVFGILLLSGPGGLGHKARLLFRGAFLAVPGGILAAIGLLRPW